MRIPRGLELPGEEVLIRSETGRLVFAPLRKKTSGLLKLLASWEPLDEEFPDVD